MNFSKLAEVTFPLYVSVDKSGPKTKFAAPAYHLELRPDGTLYIGNVATGEVAIVGLNGTVMKPAPESEPVKPAPQPEPAVPVAHDDRLVIDGRPARGNAGRTPESS